MATAAKKGRSSGRRTAIVAGAGIGGAAAAVALSRSGWDVTVLEQAPEIGEVGAGIQIGPNGVRALTALGLAERVEDVAFSPRALEMRWGLTGEKIFKAELLRAGLDRWGAPYWHVHRADLLHALLGALQDNPHVTLRTGSRVTDYREHEGGVSVMLGEKQLEADLLVGADGIHSRVRELLNGPDQPGFTGNVAWRVTVPTEALGSHAPPPTACVWVGAGKHAVTYRVRNGKLANLVAVVEHSTWSSESWTTAGSRAEALADFEGWHPTITSMLGLATQHHRWALYDRPPMDCWSSRHVALLGDACHPMLPFQAQGASMALEDSVVLASSLANASSIAAGLAGYVDARRPRTSKVQAASRANATAFHKASRRAYVPLTLVAALSPDLVRKRFDWIYGYDVTQWGQGDMRRVSSGPARHGDAPHPGGRRG